MDLVVKNKIYLISGIDINIENVDPLCVINAEFIKDSSDTNILCFNVINDNNTKLIFKLKVEDYLKYERYQSKWLTYEVVKEHLKTLLKNIEKLNIKNEIQ